MTADTLRVVTIVLSAVVVALLPAAIGWDRRPLRVWVLFAAVEFEWVRAAAAVGHSFGEPLAWWRTPGVFVADALAVGYIAASLLMRRRGGART